MNKSPGTITAPRTGTITGISGSKGGNATFHLARALLIAFCAVLLPASVRAHHSFAIFDFETQIPFEGTIETLKFRNPHIEMTLKSVDAEGKETIINFVEGAPANMLARQGLTPAQLKKGTKITGIGSPLIDDNTKFFLRSIILEDGREFRN
jgi:hypothetical protein